MVGKEGKKEREKNSKKEEVDEKRKRYFGSLEEGSEWCLVGSELGKRKSIEREKNIEQRNEGGEKG